MTDLSITLTGLAICVIVGFISLIKHFKKRDSLKASPIIPWIWPFLAAVSIGFMLLVHLVKFHMANAF